MARKKVIIIGSGVAGLAASIRSAHAGFDVHVFESNPFPGGKINSEMIGEYRFDKGPSVFTGQEYVKELYDLVGEDFSNFELANLSSSFHYFFNDGTRLNLSTKRSEIIEELATKLDEDPNVIDRYLTKSGKNYEVMAPMFIQSSLHQKKNYVSRAFFKALARLPKYKLSSTMHEENAKTFKNKKTIQIFDRFATYNGSDPYQSPAMLNMISHLEINTKPYLPKNGMIQITDSLFELAKKQGVHFHFNDKVEKINVKEGKCTGIESTSGSHTCDAIISNMDVAFTYERLMPNLPKPEKTLAQEKSSSAIVFYWGIKRAFPELSLHNIFFTDDYAKEFKAIFGTKTLYDDPTIYVNITSKLVEGDAPEGCENWFTMINSPIDVGQNWDEEIPKMRKIILDKLSRVLNVDLETYIEEESVLEPRIIQARYHGKQGSIYGNASNNRYAAFYRHPNFSKKYDNLYFAGVSVHPGGGIPLALNSAKIATKFMIKDLA